MSDPVQNNAEDIGSVPSFFREHGEFLQSLDEVATSASNVDSWALPDASEEEMRLIREMKKTLDVYQEQPTCLDPYLERIVSRLMAVVQEYVYAFHDSMEKPDSLISVTRMDGIFDLLYTLCKVRGYKVVLRFFPHGVTDVEPVFATLWRFSVDFEASSWPARYALLIWLSLLAMIPFDIETIDSGMTDLPAIAALATATNMSLIKRWVELGKLFLCKPGCEMEGAAVMLSRLLSRRDSAAILQPEFIEWAAREITDAARPVDSTNAIKSGLQIGSVLRINGALRVLCHLFSAMDSHTSLDAQIPLLLDIFQMDAFDQHSITRKLISKAVQRLALLMLPAANAEMGRAYARPSLRANLSNNAAYASASERDDEAAESPDVEVPLEMEAFVGILLHKLHDKDTIVRWSAAKGIGRISERLPLALAREIVLAVGGILKDETLVDDKGLIDVAMTTEYSWHGALLCLAELSRRGMLYAPALRQVVPWVVRGLTYEIQRGDYSVGSNVRDAACYVMWSLARIPNPSSRRVFAEMSTEMATTLISVAVFDRESNVRRAASAAFQEHVGRQSAFPHGIAVLQLADFFSVGIMRNAFVVTSRKIAEFDEYRHPLLHHLCTVTVYHWDLKTRELAVKALRELAPLSPEYVRTHLLPEIMVLEVADSVPARYIEDFGASLTLAALATYMGNLSRARWNVGDAQEKYFALFELALITCKTVDDIVVDFTSFVDACSLTPDQRLRIVKHTQVASSGTSRESFVLALGALEKQSDPELLCSLVTEGTTVEIRRNAAAALGQFCTRARDGGRLSIMWEHSAISALSRGLEDHSVDNRGDVGSWVRKQSLHSLASIFAGDGQTFQRLNECDDELAIRLLGQILCSTTEKIDRLRVAAGRMLEILLHEQRVEAADSRLREGLVQLQRLVPAQPNNFSGDAGVKGSEFSWADPEAAFTRIVQALSVSDERLRQPLFEGLVSTGSAEPLGKFAVGAVAAYAETLPETGATVAASAQPEWGVDGIVAELTRLLLTDRQTSKIINPALIVADQLIEQGALLAAAPDSWIPLYRATQRVAFKLRAPLRLSLCLKLYGSLALVSEELSRMAVGSLLAHMAHPVLRIRQTAADQLFSALCIHGVVDVGDDGDEIGRLVSETEWAQESAGVKDARAQLTALVRPRLAQDRN
ncbi:hypothetical protein GGH12_002647 [Coemansia sp. RSA 1822]|nr:hypothetical protein LPJ76_001857 [Coemansia sp. RSA 638]KAJ2563307.1 hypothetical protein GGH12_002647 [Coemansia sp. RSA 1822]